ncbi:MAG: site-2 protease family protein [Candidatus Saccharicenans sp.]
MALGKRWVNLVLFILTVVSTYFVGFLWGINYLLAEKGALPEVEIWNFKLLFNPTLVELSLIYSISLLGILLGHELGHYLSCRKYGIQATLPYFIPAPTLIGTLGAFIRIKSPFTRREELFEVGANGPLVGFFLSMPALFIGLIFSRVIPALPKESSILFGEPLLLKIFSRIILGPISENQDLILHPLAVAGWVGLLVTSFNLFPVGQLDGGHIFYALFGEKSKKISMLVVAILGFLGIFYWAGWLIWALLILLVGLKHPPVIEELQPLSLKRKITADLIVIIFILSFIPAPVGGNSLLDFFK